MLMFGFPTSVCVALSNVIIFVGSVTRFLFEFNTQHPEKKAKVIDYGISILMLPAVMIGSFIGVQINVIAPSAVILGTLGLVLVFVSVKTTKKSLALYAADKKKEEKFSKRLDSEVLLKDPGVDEQNDEDSEEIKESEMQDLSINSWMNSVMIRDHDSFNTKTLKSLKAAERTHFNLKKQTIIYLGIFAIVAVSIIRKNILEDFLFHVDQCSLVDVISCVIFMIV